MLLASSKTQLTPELIDDYSCGIGEVEAAAIGQHGNAQPGVLIESGQYLWWQATAFRAKEERIPWLELNLAMKAVGFGGAGKDPFSGEAGFQQAQGRT